MKEFFSGIVIMLIIFSPIAWQLNENQKTRIVTYSNGEKTECRVAKYRFWYQLENCKNGANLTIGLNDIKNYRIETK